MIPINCLYVECGFLSAKKFYSQVILYFGGSEANERIELYNNISRILSGHKQIALVWLANAKPRPISNLLNARIYILHALEFVSETRCCVPGSFSIFAVFIWIYVRYKILYKQFRDKSTSLHSLHLLCMWLNIEQYICISLKPSWVHG